MSAAEIIEYARLFASWSLLAAGLFFVLVGAVGVLRFPDFYTRVHAAGVTDTLGAELILLGLIVQADSFYTVAKIALMALFMFLTSPTSGHALVNAAYTAGLAPMLGRIRVGAPTAPKPHDGDNA